MINRRICLFDMDGTLTPARESLDLGLKIPLRQLLKCMDVGIVTGSDFDYVIQQCKPLLDMYRVEYEYVNDLIIYPCNGTKEYRYDSLNDSWDLVSEVNMKDTVGDKTYLNLLRHCIKSQEKIMSWCELPYTGTFLQYRGSMLNWCIIGRDAKQKERKAWVVEDHKAKIRENLIRELSNSGFEELTFSLGGSTSIDVYPNGWDKTYVLNHLKEETYGDRIYFVGDRCKGHGNDRALYEKLGPEINAFETTGPNHTQHIIQKIIKEKTK